MPELTVLVTPDAPRFAPGRHVAMPPIPCRTCGGKGGSRPIWIGGFHVDDTDPWCPDCTDGTEPLTECLIATPGTECETCEGRGIVDGWYEPWQSTKERPCPAGCTNGKRPGVVLGKATFDAGLPIARTLDPPGVDEWVYLDLHGAPTLVWRQRDGLDGSDIPASARLGVWADGNVAYPIESYTLVTDPGGCPARDMIDGIPGWMARGLKRCDVCNGEGHLTAPWSPPWLPTEPGVHRVEVEG